jgi:hypothetical protein
MAWFRRHFGVDYSGAQAPTASLKGPRVFMTEGDSKYWARRGIAEWLVERMT